MFNIIKKTISWGEKQLTLETGHLARQANASVFATLGNTSVLCTVVHANESSEESFLPLTVNYQEKYYAAGRFPGGFNKREGRPSEQEILTSRLIDRPIRPLFPEGYFYATQVQATLLSLDTEVNPDIVAIIGVSAALALSGAPWLGPIGACRVGYDGSEFILNPSMVQLKTSQLDLIVAGTREGVLMVESEAHELNESIMLQAVMFGHKSFQPVIDGIQEFKEHFHQDLEKSQQNYQVIELMDLAVVEKMKVFFQDTFASQIQQAFTIKDKIIRNTNLDTIYKQGLESYKETLSDEQDQDILDKLDFFAKLAFKKVTANILRSQILNTKKRIDGRGLQDIRPIECEIGILPMVHGSSLFTRGETQVLSSVTLGTSSDEQIMDVLMGEYRESFLLHYNFPSFSVGELGRNMGPGRREIGHGKLAWRAIHPELPNRNEFMYSIRVVSEVLESNGSSSMATVCSASMALMDAGVPLKKAVAGVAMGLIKEKDSVAILTDILGDEDHLGDMDFKVAGTSEGITSLQMDIKIPSITESIMEEALQDAFKARIFILDKMNSTIQIPHEAVSDLAPKMKIIPIAKDKIRDIIGPGGKMIRAITEKTHSKIDIDDEGNVTVSSSNDQDMQQAVTWIQSLVQEPEVGKEYVGTIVNILSFGAFVQFMPNKEGLLHVSEISGQRINNVSDVLSVGQKVKVKCLAIDDKGKVRLSMKGIVQEFDD